MAERGAPAPWPAACEPATTGCGTAFKSDGTTRELANASTPTSTATAPATPTVTTGAISDKRRKAKRAAHRPASSMRASAAAIQRCAAYHRGARRQRLFPTTRWALPPALNPSCLRPFIARSLHQPRRS